MTHFAYVGINGSSNTFDFIDFVASCFNRYILPNGIALLFIGGGGGGWYLVNTQGILITKQIDPMECWCFVVIFGMC